MAHIHIIHNSKDAAVAERISSVLYFLDYEINLLTAESPLLPGSPEDYPSAVYLVLWTPNAQNDRWLTGLCRDIEQIDKLITVVPRSAGAPALPVMLHRGSIVHLEHANGRMRLETLQTFLSEVGIRSDREGLVSGVAALLQPEEEERVQALSQWVAQYPNDSLSQTVTAVIQNGATAEIHSALADVIDSVISNGTGFMEIAGGLADKVQLPTRLTPMMYYAGIGVVAFAAFLATLLPIVNRPTETVELEKIEVPSQMSAAGSPGAEFAEAMSPPPDMSSETSDLPTLTIPEASYADEVGRPLLDEDLEETVLADTDVYLEEEFEAVGDVEAEFEVTSPIAPETDTVDDLDGDRTTVASLTIDPNEPSLGVPDPNTVLAEPVAVADTAALELPDEADADVEVDESIDPSDETELAEESELVDLDAPAQQAELLLPYISGEQGPGDAFTDRLADETGAPIMVVVPQGSFVMGSPLNERGRDISESPQRTVSVGRSFAVSKFEVSVGEYEKFVAATGHDTGNSCQTYSNDTWSEQSGRSYNNTGFRQSPSHPATCVDWYDATAYADWLSKETGQPYRLLSESEWEYAARAGSDSAFPFGSDANEGCEFLNGADKSSSSSVSSSRSLTCSDGAAYSAKVGSYLPNRFGLYDMHGNVWEWTLDSWHTSYEGAPRTSRVWETGGSAERVVRGGSWFTFDWWLRSASRRGFEPGDRRYDLGFRVARDL